LIIFALLIGGHNETNSLQGCKSIGYGGGLVFIPTLLMILFRQKYPKWWFDWNFSLIGLPKNQFWVPNVF